VHSTSSFASVDFEAREHVHEVVESSRTSFLQGMRMLPEERREAMFAIYAFCREIDDIADEPAPPQEKSAQLKEWRREIGRLYEGRPASLTGRALLTFVRAYGLEREDFLALIDGMEMDAAEDIRAPSLERLELYCDRVAGAVGRLSVRAFGASEPAAKQVAHELGLALQFTNILRDIKEDALRGRLYLPAELLAAQGIPVGDPLSAVRHPRFAAACAAFARLARERYARAAAAMRGCRRATMRPAAMMMAAYRAILERLERRGWDRIDEPVSLPKPLKMWIALRHAVL
jgi:phytoene synthase